jgi:hypothetical protein
VRGLARSPHAYVVFRVAPSGQRLGFAPQKAVMRLPDSGVGAVDTFAA